MTKSSGKDRARADRAEKLAKALRTNLARRKQAHPVTEAADRDPEAEGAYRRRDDDLTPLGRKAGRRQ